MDPANVAIVGSGILVSGCVGLIVYGAMKVAGKYDRDIEAMASPDRDGFTPSVPVYFPATGTDDEGWTEPPRIVLSGEPIAEAHDRLSQSVAKLGAIGAVARLEPCPEPPATSIAPAEGAIQAERAIFHTAQALAELTRYNRQGATSDRFPLEEDVEVFLAKALQDTINILLAYNPTEHERGELAQLEAALHKFITDYGA